MPCVSASARDHYVSTLQRARSRLAQMAARPKHYPDKVLQEKIESYIKTKDEISKAWLSGVIVQELQWSGLAVTPDLVESTLNYLVTSYRKN